MARTAFLFPHFSGAHSGMCKSAKTEGDDGAPVMAATGMPTPV